MPKGHPGHHDEWPLKGLIVSGRLVKEEVSNVGWPGQFFNRNKKTIRIAGLLRPIMAKNRSLPVEDGSQRNCCFPSPFVAV
jgi:hypothetical protein